MSFNAGELVATIRLDGLPEYERGVDRAGQKLTSAGRSADTLGRTMSGVLKGASVATTALVTAGGAYMKSLFDQGKAYNGMQQASRAALKTLVGGTKEANAQMDRLDDFAKTSPFAKEVFITAQQQLIGFGMEAKKVIPTLDAVQDAVAATGGSSEDLSEITFVLAQIQGAGKITGRDLMRLGQRGIDAAKLIGSEMGKSGQEIRDEISSGALDADTALDALTKGMAKKFDGAAANVKETWSGVQDRIRAASRDIGSRLAEPFVAHDQGGMYITWGNQVADVMRAVEGHVTPVVDALVNRAMPAFAGFTGLLDETVVKVKAWDSSKIESGLDAIAQNAPGIAGVAGAIGAVSLGFARTLPVLGRFVPAINPVAGALIGITAASPEVRDALGNVADAASPLIDVATRLASVLSDSLNGALPVVAGGINLVADVAGPLVDTLAAIPTPVLTTVAVFLTMRKAFTGLTPALEGAGRGLEGIRDHMRASRSIARETGGQITTMGAAARASTGKIKGLGRALKTAFIANPIGLILTAAASAVAIWASANAKAQEKVKEHKEKVKTLADSLDEATGAATDATRQQVAQQVVQDGLTKSLDKAGVSSSQYVDALTGVAGSADAIRDKLHDSALAAVENTDAQDKMSRVSDALGISQDTVFKAAMGNADAWEIYSDALEGSGAKAAGASSQMSALKDILSEHAGAQIDVNNALQKGEDEWNEAQQKAKEYRDAVDQANQAMSDTERSNKRLNDALAIVRDTTADATERLNALKQALDELNGGHMSAAEAARKQARDNLDLEETLDQVDSKGKKLWKSFLDGKGAIDVTTEAGNRFAEKLGGMTDRYLDVTRAAYDKAKAQGQTEAEASKTATKAAKDYISTLRDTLSQAGLTEDQIDGLIDTYFDVPEVVTTLIEDNGTISATDQQILGLINRIKKTPDGKTITVKEPMSKAVRKRLQDLGFTVKTLPDGTIKVTASNVGTVENALNNLARNRTSTVTVTYFQKPGGKAPDTGHDASKIFKADGGILDGRSREMFAGGGFHGVPQFADGAENHVAQISGPVYRIWAEPETGGEAYIPLSPTKRGRSLQIWEETGRRLGVAGFADGGTTGKSTIERASASEYGPLVENVNFVNTDEKHVRSSWQELEFLLRHRRRGGKR